MESLKLLEMNLMHIYLLYLPDGELPPIYVSLPGDNIPISLWDAKIRNESVEIDHKNNNQIPQDETIPFVICMSIKPQKIKLSEADFVNPSYLIEEKGLYVSVICKNCTNNFERWKECHLCHYRYPNQFNICSVHKEVILDIIPQDSIVPRVFDPNRNVKGVRPYNIKDGQPCDTCKFQIQLAPNNLTLEAPINHNFKKCILRPVAKIQKYLSELIWIFLAICLFDLQDTTVSLESAINSIDVEKLSFVVEIVLSFLWLIGYIIYEEKILHSNFEEETNGHKSNIQKGRFICLILFLLFAYSLCTSIRSICSGFDDILVLIVFIIHRFVYTPYKFGYKMYNVWNYPFTASMDRDKNSRLDVYFNNL